MNRRHRYVDYKVSRVIECGKVYCLVSVSDDVIERVKSAGFDCSVYGDVKDGLVLIKRVDR
jgi:hypothetical protein